MPALGARLGCYTGGREMNRLTPFALVGLLTAFSFNSRAQTVWTERNPHPTANTLQGLVWTGTQVVAVGPHGTVVTSPDGISWTKRRTGLETDFFSVAWTGTQ